MKHNDILLFVYKNRKDIFSFQIYGLKSPNYTHDYNSRTSLNRVDLMRRKKFGKKSFWTVWQLGFKNPGNEW